MEFTRAQTDTIRVNQDITCIHRQWESKVTTVNLNQCQMSDNPLFYPT